MNVQVEEAREVHKFYQDYRLQKILLHLWNYFLQIRCFTLNFFIRLVFVVVKRNTIFDFLIVIFLLTHIALKKVVLLLSFVFLWMMS